MRIGISSTKIEPNLCRGQIDGIGVYTQNLITEYQKLQLPIVQCAYPPFFNKPPLANSIYFSKPYALAGLCALLPLAQGDDRIQARVDLFHATDYHIPRLSGTPVVATLHDAIMLKYPEWCNPHLRRFKNYLLKTMARSVQHIITITHAMVPEIVEYFGIDEQKISVVYNGIDESWHQKIAPEVIAEVRKRFNLPPHYLLFVGTLQPRKNLARLIAAFERLPLDIQKTFPLIIVGKAGCRSTDLQQKIAKLQQQGKVLWLQYVATRELQALYQGASIFIFPSLAEGFGIPLLEAFASGTPVITSDIPALREVTGNAATFINPLEIDQIHHAIMTLLSQSALRQDLITQGFSRAQDFSWQRCAAETLNVYSKLL